MWIPLSLAAAAAVFLVVERVPALRRRRARVLRPGFVTDVAYLLIGFLGLGQLGVLGAAAADRWLGGLGVPRASLAAVVAVPVALVLLDLGNYLAHYLLHRVPALWRLHRVHHSSRTLDWLATFRAHLGEQLLRRALAPLGVLALGLPTASVLSAGALLTLWALLNHANVELPLRWLEPLFITPRLHQRHHTPGAGTHNLGTLLSVWDRLRGELDRRELPRDAELGLGGQNGGILDGA